jgi:hypothetical protein
VILAIFLSSYIVHKLMAGKVKEKKGLKSGLVLLLVILGVYALILQVCL